MQHVRTLCRRAQQGDRHAASELLKMFHQAVFSYLRRLCGNDHDAEALTQETFVKAWQSLGGYRRRCRFSTWLHKIAYNAYVDRLRRSDPVLPLRDEWLESSTDRNPGPFEKATARELADELCRAIDLLDEDRRQLIHLHYYPGLSLRDTAHVLGTPTSTVKYRLRAAMTHLRVEVLRAGDSLDDTQTAPLNDGGRP